VEHAEGHGDKLFQAVCKLGLEGIVSKKLDSTYRSGKSKAWIKVKIRRHRLQLGHRMEHSKRAKWRGMERSLAGGVIHSPCPTTMNC
jgi:bifunctional non-homologous end joining protein LigD